MNFKNNKLKFKKAFTLIEMIAVLAIIGILSSVLYVSYTKYVDKSKTEINCHRMFADIDSVLEVKYDDYVNLRAERREQQLRAYENQQKEIADIKDFIERFRYKPTKAVQVQSRIKQLEKIIPIPLA